MKIHPQEVVDLFEIGEARRVFMWPRAKRYTIVQGMIYADGERLKEDDRPNYRNVNRQSPLSDPQLFQSFARLASHNGPSPARILRWVEKHGLLRRKDASLPGDAYISDGGVNQAEMSITDFQDEVTDFRALLDLYVQIRKRRTSAIANRIANPASSVDETLANTFPRKAALVSPDGNIDRRGAEYAVALIKARHSKAPNVTLSHADEVLCRLVSERLDGIRPRLASGFEPKEIVSLTAREVIDLPRDEADRIFAPPKTYWLQQSWSCSDLLGAIYLQFYLWISGNKPFRICENKNCLMPFPLTRKDKRFCRDSCAVGSRYHKKKEGR